MLPAVRDIANGSKHLKLTQPSWTKSEVHAEVVGQGVTIRVPVAEAVVDSDGVLKNVGSAGGSTQYIWTVLVDDDERDAIELGQAAVAEWDRWLSAKGLL
ncbi:hypothetical protein BTZ20_3793 [Rhodococcus sp. MTM3W5.2]|nr:hypothetical protein BTZ20_3793 [Rhodococcus sp. MTM3W5.2]